MESVAILSLLLVVVIPYGFSCVQTCEIHCIEGEKNALIKFIQGFKNSSQNMLWLDENCCQWKGVKCDNKTGHVITLDLQNQFLQGEFGISLLDLPHLVHLDMSQIDFQGAHIPDFISSFKNLEYLNLSKTNFRGEIPENLGNLSRLQFLDLSGYYSLSVSSLKWIQPLFSMKTLDLSGVNMRSAENWLHDINMLSSLSELRLSACQLTTFPELLPINVSFTSLRVLDLSLNYFDTSIPSWLFHTCQDLVYLNLSRSQLDGLIPNDFGNMSSLRVLDLSKNSLRGNLSHSCEKMSSLSFLDLSRNSFTVTFAYKGSSVFAVASSYSTVVNLTPDSKGVLAGFDPPRPQSEINSSYCNIKEMTVRNLKKKEKKLIDFLYFKYTIMTPIYRDHVISI
uniref:Leucine-rich repeat-containing N-terminal plant-type domain-containing protein n=1 Tax=Solanum lycopersicum TaxID=4081 RepID=A0A3Q7J1L5_SOLLC